MGVVASWPRQRYCQKRGEQPKWQVPQATYKRETQLYWFICGDHTVQWATTPLLPLAGVCPPLAVYGRHAPLGVKEGACRGQVIWGKGGPVLQGMKHRYLALQCVHGRTIKRPASHVVCWRMLAPRLTCTAHSIQPRTLVLAWSTNDHVKRIRIWWSIDRIWWCAVHIHLDHGANHLGHVRVSQLDVRVWQYITAIKNGVCVCVYIAVCHRINL